MRRGSDDQILIITDSPSRDDSGRVERGAGASVIAKGASAVSVAVLKANMEAFFGQLREILSSGDPHLGPFAIERVEVFAQVTGDGQIGLMGAGAHIGVQGGIKLVLHRAAD